MAADKLFRTGETLREFIAGQEKNRLPSVRRDAAAGMLDRILGRTGEPGQVVGLYGLRRCGKTTLMLQCMADAMRAGVPAERMAFFDIPHRVKSPDGNMRASLFDVMDDMDRLRDAGVDIFFIDEATALDDFEACARLANDFGRTGSVFLAGTDSLAFLIAMEDELFKRMEHIRLTRIPYAEYSHIVPGTDIDGYIERGGLFTGRLNCTPEANRNEEVGSLAWYLNSAVVENIMRALDLHLTGSIRRERVIDVIEQDGLVFRSVVQRIVNQNGLDFTIRQLRRKFGDHAWGSLTERKRLNDQPDERRFIEWLGRPEIDRFLSAYAKRLGILNADRHPKAAIDDPHFGRIMHFLVMLDLFMRVPRHEIVYYRDGRMKSGGETEITHVLSQPGMRWSQVETLIQELVNEIAGSDEKVLSVEPKDFDKVQETLKNFTRGQVLGEIVLSDTLDAIERQGAGLAAGIVRFLEDPEDGTDPVSRGEFDMIVAETSPRRCWCFEVKHSDERHENQYRHLNSKDPLIEKRFGRIAGRVVLYRGEEHAEGDIRWVNVGRFLKNIHADVKGTLRALASDRPSASGRPAASQEMSADDLLERVAEDPMILRDVAPENQDEQLVRAAMAACRANSARHVNPGDLLPLIRPDLRESAGQAGGRWKKERRIGPDGSIEQKQVFTEDPECGFRMK